MKNICKHKKKEIVATNLMFCSTTEWCPECGAIRKNYLDEYERWKSPVLAKK